jgi:alpha-tubulin suppressor-like RCC1 family protein
LPISTPIKSQSVSAGIDFMVALSTENQIYSWGNNRCDLLLRHHGVHYHSATNLTVLNIYF